MCDMRKNINDYEVYVFDLDGTLYDQPNLRRIMALRLLSYYILHPFAIRELLILRHFRKVKDASITSREDTIIDVVAADMGTDAGKVRTIVDKWIYKDPLGVIRRTKDVSLAGWMADLRQQGKKVIVFSDYPTKDKLDALEIKVDKSYGPEDERIDELKPSPKGLEVIMSDLGVGCDSVLMIGDRMEKDGMSAQAAGVDSLILERKVSKRKINELKG